jgi:hypothetical protein
MIPTPQDSPPKKRRRLQYFMVAFVAALGFILAAVASVDRWVASRDENFIRRRLETEAGPGTTYANAERILKFSEISYVASRDDSGHVTALEGVFHPPHRLPGMRYIIIINIYIDKSYFISSIKVSRGVDCVLLP